MIDNRNEIILVKESIKSVFNIGICSSQGILYCMYSACDTEVSGASLSKTLLTQFISHMQSWNISAKKKHRKLQKNWVAKLQEVHCEHVMHV